MNQKHSHNKEISTSHLENAFDQLKKTLSLSASLREAIRLQVLERIEISLEEETSASLLFSELKDTLFPQRSIVANTKLQLFNRIEKKKRHSWKFLFERIFGSALGYGLSFIFVLSLTSLFLVSNLQPSKAEYIGELQIRQGNAFIVRSSSKFEVRSGEKVLPGDVIEVGDTGLVDINFYQERQANLHSNTKVRIEKDQSNQSDIVLSLEKGKLAATPGIRSGEKGSITVATVAGTVKAPETSAFVLEVDATSNKASLKVEQSEVELLATNSSNGNQNTGELVASTVSSGQEKLLLASGEAQELPVPSSLLVFANPADFAPVGNQNENSSATPSQTTRRGQASIRTQVDTIGSEAAQQLDLPQTKEMSVHSSMRLTTIHSDLEIAKVKFKQLLDTANQDPRIAANYAQGYVQTVQRIADALSTTAVNSIPAQSTNVSEVLIGSTLSKVIEDLPALSKDLEGGEKNIAYVDAKRALEELYTLESAVIIHSKLSENNTIASLPPVELNTLSTLKSLESDSGYNTKARIESAIEGDIFSRVENVMKIEDRSTRATMFVTLLSSIPDDARNIKLLENLQTKVSDDLKGFVSVKIHTIRNSTK